MAAVRRVLSGLGAACGKATLKTKFVSCPADGQNYGHNFFFFSFLYLAGKKIPPPPKKSKIGKKILVSTNNVTRPHNRKTNFSKGGLKPLGAGFYYKSGGLCHTGTVNVTGHGSTWGLYKLETRREPPEEGSLATCKTWFKIKPIFHQKCIR